MSNRKSMFVPLNFDVEKPKMINVYMCRLIPYSRANDRSYNSYVQRFQGDESLEEWDIYYEGNLAQFRDRLDLLFHKQKESLV